MLEQTFSGGLTFLSLPAGLPAAPLQSEIGHVFSPSAVTAWAISADMQK